MEDYKMRNILNGTGLRAQRKLMGSGKDFYMILRNLDR